MVLLDQIKKDPEYSRYRVSYSRGQTLFLEGDESQDLYVLISGEVGVIKGDKLLATLVEPGTLFGEMSVLLGNKRTATVRALTDAEVFCIPADRVKDFLLKYPEAAQTITRLLAQRLDETSQILYGLREFVDNLPDAVLLLDRSGKIVTMNPAARDLYGLGSERYECGVDQLCQEPEVFKDLILAAQQGHPVREEILEIKHPQKGIRYISTSMTVLYDANHNFQGVLSLGRDVTSVKRMERRLKRFLFYLAPLFIMLAALAAVTIYGFPYFLKGRQNLNIQHQEFKTILAKDYFLLKKLLMEPLLERDREKSSRLMKDFLKLQDPTTSPYTGLLLLDEDKVVFDAYSLIMGDEAKRWIGTTYARLRFMGDRDSLHKVLVVYRRSKSHPGGEKGLEVAFEMLNGRKLVGWLVFQLDPAKLAKLYGLDTEALVDMRFDRERYE